MGFEGIVMTVSVRDFLFDGIKTGTAGWMIGLRKDQPQQQSWKKVEPRNPVPGPFSAKIRKVNQNSESRGEFGK